MLAGVEGEGEEEVVVVEEGAADTLVIISASVSVCVCALLCDLLAVSLTVTHMSACLPFSLSYTHAQAHIVYQHICTYADTDTQACAHTHTHSHTHSHTYTHTCVLTHTHTHIHTHTHTYTHTLHGWDFPGYSQISGFRCLSEGNKMVLRCILSVISHLSGFKL